MDFRLLQTRLLAQMRARVSNGEMTERGMARVTGVSQPHLHNVLKGARLLSIEMADQILHRLRIDLADLLAAGEEASAQAHAGNCGCRNVPVLEGQIGPGHPYPTAIGRSHYPFPAAEVDRLGSPVGVWLAPDPHRPRQFSGGGVALLDRSGKLRRAPPEDAYFALDLRSEGTIARVRRAGSGWCSWFHESGGWEPISGWHGDPLDLIKGRVTLVVQRA
ncbi:MAG TPA: helix-turn-helix transcriptional regulator [Bryobacteraceae bacterium]|nr:helix-turn-helix transcriptional regulator [Bryobacteraceae bacterium]